MKLFISHAEKDYDVVEKFIDLLITIGLNEDDIFCSSMPGFGIPSGENIYEYLKKLFKTETLYVVFMLSNNYYHSAACLNEMGAAWITQKKYISFLLPGFDFDDMKGAVDPRNISIKLGSSTDTVKAQINSFKDTLTTLFNKHISDVRWEHKRNSFLESIKDNSNVDLTMVKSYTFCENIEVCTIIDKHTDELHAKIDFTEGTTELCSLAIFPQTTNWTKWYKEGYKLSFQTAEYNTVKEVTLEIKFDNWIERYPISFSNESKNYSVRLKEICNQTVCWKNIKEICFLINKCVNDSNSVFGIKNLMVIK